LTNNALQECHCGRIDQIIYPNRILRDDKDKNCDKSNNAEIKIAAVKDKNKTQQEKKQLRSRTKVL
jgi:hypothetical protein